MDSISSTFSYEKSYMITYALTFLSCGGAYIDPSLTKFAGALYNDWTTPYFALIVTLDISDSGTIV